MILIYALGPLSLLPLAAFWLGRFPISREDHEARIARREAASEGQAEAQDAGPKLTK